MAFSRLEFVIQRKFKMNLEENPQDITMNNNLDMSLIQNQMNQLSLRNSGSNRMAGPSGEKISEENSNPSKFGYRIKSSTMNSIASHDEIGSRNEEVERIKKAYDDLLKEHREIIKSLKVQLEEKKSKEEIKVKETDDEDEKNNSVSINDFWELQKALIESI